MSWKKRLFVVSYEKQDDEIFTKTKKFISDNTCKIKDRNLEIIYYEKFDNIDYSKLEFINNKYGIWLIGHDGMIKDYSSDAKIFLKLFYLIDSMPMRKNELIKNKC